jgi:hypothetical protein
MITTTHADLSSQLGVDLDSPISWLHYSGDQTRPPKPYYSLHDEDSSRDRFLESKDDNSDWLVDEDGNSYEPYSLAWRYLGMYIECEKDQDEDDQEQQDDSRDNRRRYLSSSDDRRRGCARKLLWAAVGEIGRHSQRATPAIH